MPIPARYATFVAQRQVALVGVARDGSGFGNMLRRALLARGYTVQVVHPEARTIEGTPCARSLTEIASQVTAVVLVTPPAATLRLVREASGLGLRHIWVQQGAGSPDVVQVCADAGLTAIHDQCLLMFLDKPGILHSCHRVIKELTGGMPVE